MTFCVPLLSMNALSWRHKTSYFPSRQVLTDRPGIRPAPYMASRGLKWVQHHAAPGLPEPELRDHIAASYDMIAAKLPRRTRKTADQYLLDRGT